MATATFATALAVLSVLGAVSRVCGSVQAENIIEVSQVVEGRTAHLHCAHDTSLEHILLSGWWEAVWQRMYRPNTVAEMTSKASSSVVFRNTTPSTGEGNNFAVSLEMRSSAVIANAGVEQQDLYSCLFQDSTGQIISQCFVMLVVKKGDESLDASPSEHLRSIVAQQQTGYAVSSRSDGAVTLVCWQFVTNANDSLEWREWYSGGEPLGQGPNENMSFQTNYREYNLTSNGTSKAQLHLFILITFAKPPQQNFTCVKRQVSGIHSTAVPFSVNVGGGSDHWSQAGDAIRLKSKPALFVIANRTGELPDRTSARCYKSGPKTEAHNSRGNTPTPVWYVDDVPSSALNHLPHWAHKSTCAQSGEWISLEIRHGSLQSDAHLSCRLEHHTVASGQPHCDIAMTNPDGMVNDISLADSPTDSVNKTGKPNGKDGGVHVESLQSDGIIAVVILGVALLISVTTVITIYKRRERNIIRRRIRQRYLGSMPSDANISSV